MSSLDNNSRNTHPPLPSPAVSYGRSPRLTALSAAPRQLPSAGLSLASGPGVSPDPSSFVSQTAAIIHVPEPWCHCYPSQLTWKLAVWARLSGDLGPWTGHETLNTSGLQCSVPSSENDDDQQYMVSTHTHTHENLHSP